MRPVLLVALLFSCTSADHGAPSPLLASLTGAGAFPVMPPVEAKIIWTPGMGKDDAPIRLTAADGTGLALQTLSVRGVIADPLAFTELTMVFDNPTDRVMEGRFEITLPDDAAIGRFAMKIGGQWQEGEVVEKQAARRIYEDYLHRGQDPALLEQKAGNQFRARVFPIPARGRKEIVLAYSHELRAGDEPFRVLTAGLPDLEKLDVDLLVDTWSGRTRGQDHVTYSRSGRPEGDLTLTLNTPSKNVALRSGDLAVMRISPQLGAMSADLGEVTVLVDTSASRALGFDAQLQRLGDLVGELGRTGTRRVRVVAFDQTVQELYDGAPARFGSPHLDALRERAALGASDLGAALADVSRRPTPRVLLVTDGISTAGERDASALADVVAHLADLGVRRLDAIVEGGIRDTDLLETLGRKHLPEDGVVVEGGTAADRIVARLRQTTGSGIAVRVPGADWVWPETLDGVQTGDEVLIYAKIPAARELSVQLDGAHLAGRLTTLDGERALIERATARAEIERLEAAEAVAQGDQKARLAERIVALSTGQRVLSSHTALLVLESEQEYVRYGLDRRALANVLTVGPDGLQVIDRKGIVVPPPDVVVDRWQWRSEDKKEKTAAEKGDVSGAEFDGDAFADGVVDAPMPAAETVSTPAPPPMASPRPATGASSEAYAHDEAEHAARRLAPVRQEASRSRAPEPSAPTLSIRSDDRGRGGPALREAPPEAKPVAADPWEGRLAKVMKLLERGRVGDAEAEARAWRAEDPGDVLALIALGEVLEARGRLDEAARVYGSIIDLFPSRADLRRMAGERLLALGDRGVVLAADTFAVAVEQRPDHMTGHRLLGWALLRAGEHEAAFDALRGGLDAEHVRQRPGVDRVLQDDLGLIGAAWIKAAPAQADAIRKRLTAAGTHAATQPTTRFVLSWETDANDVDLHVWNNRGDHAYYSSPALGSEGGLYADVTNGYGPEAVVVQGDAASYPYKVQAHYYRRGPLGYGMGTLQIVQHDGKGGLAFADEPFVLQRDDAFIDLTVLEKRL